VVSFSKIAVSGQTGSPHSTFCPVIAIIHKGLQHIVRIKVDRVVGTLVAQHTVGWRPPTPRELYGG
jgi:hypothetical protein